MAAPMHEPRRTINWEDKMISRVQPMWIARVALLCGFVSGVAQLCQTDAAFAQQAAATKALADKDITAAVESEFFEDSAVPHNDVEVSTTSGVVTLTGTVSNLLARDHAQRLAQTVRGVRAVVNRVAVQPKVDRSDDELKRVVQNALAYDPAADAYELKVTVQNKVVTLSGKVQSFAERDLAERVARSVAGVRDVRNAIALEYKPRSDGEVLADVRARLRWDAYVEDDLIRSSVKDGVVTLTGSVGSDAERSRAFFDAWVVGARAVDTKALKVEPWLGEQHARKPSPKVSDAELIKAVDAALLYDPRVSSYNLNVDATGGVVTLRGVVDDLEAKHSAVLDARATTGVARVVDHVRVKSTPANDVEIAKQIREAMGRDPYVERFEVLVKVNDGTAYLTGTVDSNFEKMRADQIASRATGVQRVQNSLTVYDDRSPLVFEPRVYDFYPYEYAWYSHQPRTYATDADIRDDIRDEIYWSPFVDAGDVKVRVSNGVATLEGNVSSYSEMHSAMANAYEGGATAVINQLRID